MPRNPWRRARAPARAGPGGWAGSGPRAGPAPASAGPAPSPAATAYLDAVRRGGDAAAVEKALAGGVDVDTPFRYGRTALSFAADRGHVEESCGYLLAKGAKLDVADTFYNQTALGWASVAGADAPARARAGGQAAAGEGRGRAGRPGARRRNGAGDAAMVQAILETGGHTDRPGNLSRVARRGEEGRQDRDRRDTREGRRRDAGGGHADARPGRTVSGQLQERGPGSHRDRRRRGRPRVDRSFGGGPRRRRSSPRSETDFVAEGVPGGSATFAFEGNRASTVTGREQAGVSSVYKRVEAMNGSRCVGPMCRSRSRCARAAAARRARGRAALAVVPRPPGLRRRRRPAPAADLERPHGQRAVEDADSRPRLSCPIVWGDRVFVTTAVSSDPDAVPARPLRRRRVGQGRRPARLAAIASTARPARSSGSRSPARACRRQAAPQGEPGHADAGDRRHARGRLVRLGGAVLLRPRRQAALEAGPRRARRRLVLRPRLPVGHRQLADHLQGPGDRAVRHPENSFLAAYRSRRQEVWRTRDEIPSWGTPT